MYERFAQENKVSNEIMFLRKGGSIDQAISMCLEAIEKFPDNNFFCKILGDMYFQQGDYAKAANAYLDDLKKMRGTPKLFRTFQTFYQKLLDKVDDVFLVEYKGRIWNAIEAGEFSEDIEKCCIEFFGEGLIADSKLLQTLKESDSAKFSRKVKSDFRKWCKAKDSKSVEALIGYRIKSEHHKESIEIDHEIFRYLEKEKRYQEALIVAQKINQPIVNKATICSILRICRNLDDYSVAEKIFPFDEEFISESDFNVQYELVYYYQKTQEPEKLSLVLKKMNQSATRSIPIAQTLYNFYLSLNMFDEAQAVYERIPKMKSKRQRDFGRSIEQKESDHVVWQKLKDLVSEQEHNRQMIALRDLLKGFSHELGQPITNIRYEVQLLQMKLDIRTVEKEELYSVIDNILNQTTRIGTLLSRFGPIVSQKNLYEDFCVVDCIKGVFDDLQTRLRQQDIQYSVKGSDNISLYGDRLQFTQVFYNLILNSMQAMQKSGKIDVTVKKDGSGKISISFMDDGPGIPKENQKKIFEPFFSTKDPTSGNGGEGLGLFIVWNVLKIFNGIIYVDSHYKNGAKFNILITPQGGSQSEQSIDN